MAFPIILVAEWNATSLSEGLGPFLPGFLQVLVGIVALVAFFTILAGLLLAGSWLMDRLPSVRARATEEAERAVREANRRAEVAEEELRALRAASERDVKAARGAEEAARSEAALASESREEARRAAERMEAAALAKVQDASAKEAAAAAEVRRVGVALAAAERARDEAQAALARARAELSDLRAQHDGTLADLRKLRDCAHAETATVYTRETDPATKLRPYRNAGAMCRRCGYVRAAPGPEDITSQGAARPLAAD